MSRFCIRFAVDLERLVERDPELLVGDDPRNSRFDGSGASSATTPIAPARLWPARSADASTSRFSGSCSANSCRCFRARLRTKMLSAIGGHQEHEPDGRIRTPPITPTTRPTATDAQTIRVGSNLICATSTSSANPSIHRKLRLRCFWAPTAASRRSTSFRRSAARSSGNVTNSPRRATSSLFVRRLSSARIVKKPSRSTAAAMSGISSGDWSSSSWNAGLYGAAFPVEGLVYEKETGSAFTTATSTATSWSG